MNVEFRPQSASVSVDAPSVGASIGNPVARDYLTDRDPYEGSYDITPTEETQTLETDGLRMTGDLVVEPIPGEYVGSAIPRRTAADLIAIGNNVTTLKGYYERTVFKAVPSATIASATSLTVNPTLEVDYDTGTITATNSASETVSPIQSAGYVTTAATHGVNVSGNTATQLFTQDATTYTPSNVAQILPAGRFLVGDQTISAVAPPFYDMSTALAWMGPGAELVSQNFYKKVDYLKNTSWHGWTPSTTAKTLVSSQTLTSSKFAATDIDQYTYYIIWECGVDPVYTGTPTETALPQLGRAYFVQALVKRPSSWANIQALACNGTVNQNVYSSSFLRYFGTTVGTSTYTWSASYGFYFAVTAPEISSTTVVSPDITPKTPTFSARCSSTYLSTTNAGLVDENNTKWWILGSKIYRAKKDTLFDGVYRELCASIIATPPTA